MAFTASSIMLALTVAALPPAETPAGPVALSPAVAATELMTPQPAAGTPRIVETWMIDRPESRPAALPALYATLGAMHALDAYSTSRALNAGATEANPLMRKAAGSVGAMLAVKAASTAATIYFAERAWKKNRKGAVVLMVAINGAMAAVNAHNLKTAGRR